MTDAIRYGAGGVPMVTPVQPVKNEKKKVLQEILEENPNEEHTHEDGTTHAHEGGSEEHSHDDGFDEEHGDEE